MSQGPRKVLSVGEVGGSTRRRDAPSEREIAAVLVPRLEHENRATDTLIACQRDICWREGRVDVLVVNGALAGFEIKSGRDSLARLPRQVDLYSRVLDYATLVCDARHVAAVEELLPAWWGLRQVANVDGEIDIVELRPALSNPWVLPHDLARLLSYDELYDELVRVRRVAGTYRLRRAEMTWRLVELTQLDELRAIVRARLGQRSTWRAAVSRT